MFTFSAMKFPPPLFYSIYFSVEELKQQLLQDTDFIQQIKKSVVIEEDAGKVIEEEQSDGLDMDEGMLMAGLSMFENNL